MENLPQNPVPMPPLLSKEQINLLPLRKYEGPVEVIRDPGRLAEAMAGLHRERVLGFDIEVRPAFRSGDRFPPALVQLAGEAMVCLLQLKPIADLGPLAELFEDGGVIKAGVAVSGDIAKLHEVFPFAPAGFVELGDLAGRKGIKASGVRTLAAALLGMRISKGAQCSNWERANLAPPQVSYAATDAWVCREIYLHLQAMPDLARKKKKTNDTGHK
jgi:ribonuclease D